MAFRKKFATVLNSIYKFVSTRSYRSSFLNSKCKEDEDDFYLMGDGQPKAFEVD